MNVSVSEKALIDKFALEKCNVAWFKLAEFVGRKEKERAIGVYKLLSHSLPDDAFAAQLEGDLFLAFNDEKALNAYQRSAYLYEKNDQIMHAAFVYEHMLGLRPDNKEYLIQALRLYGAIKNDVKIARCARQLVRLLIKNDSLEAHGELIENLACSIEYQWYVQESAVLALIEFHPDKTEYISDYLAMIIRASDNKIDYTQRLSLFFAKISSLNNLWYERARALVSSYENITGQEAVGNTP